MKKKMLLGMLAVALMAPIAAVQALPVLTIDASGHLTGAKGVVVGSNTYNVTFQPGSCQSLFNGCVQSAFDFTTGEEVVDAAAALLNTVFLDSALGNFDTHPELINGCGFASFCFVVMPFEVLSPTIVLTGDAQNFAGAGDSPGCCSGSFSSDFYTGAFTYADWELVPVAEPTTLALFSLGLAGLALRRRRRTG